MNSMAVHQSARHSNALSSFPDLASPRSSATPMQLFSSPLTAPATSPAPAASPDPPRGTKRKIFAATTHQAPQTPTRRGSAVMIDLCTPSPAAERVYDLLGLGKRQPLAEVAPPNGGSSDGDRVQFEKEDKADKERSSFEGYMALCRMTRQASQRSGIRKVVISGERADPVVHPSTDSSADSTEAETAEQRERRFAAWRQRNARAVMGRSRGAGLTRGLAPGKGFVRHATMDGSELVDTLPATRTRYMRSFSSHIHEDVIHVEPNPEHNGFRIRDWSPVYACSYSHAAKRASNQGPKLLALATESGTVKLIDTRYGATHHRSAVPGTTSWQLFPHQNAVFDVQWDASDERLLTASGDQHGAVNRLREGEVVREALLQGHTSSLKTCAWYDQNTVLTAGRDGSILIFDLRTAGSWHDDLGIELHRYQRARVGNAGIWDQQRIAPVMSIRNAHGENYGKKPSARSAVRSVTSLLALKTDRNLIASGGSADGVVKFWDIRAQLASPRRIFVSEAASETLDRTADRGRRSRGIISLIEAQGKVYAMCNDARIHSHAIASPRLALPTFYTHPNMTTSSFYLKLAVSPCEGYLACGTTAGRFAMWGIERDFLGRWDAPGGEAVNAVQGVECGFGGHTRQVGAIDWAADQIATGSDDYSSRVWRPDEEAYTGMREGQTGASYWAGSVAR
ncbi:hypothetical protein NliqN6_2311 [Naganishia liquefaciens]|uniref:WD40 repeat domain-containing protein n=1 Tax=Naganishia liquefaciens TaxID=104408 RepID=A0A8H3TTF2_9TREE|nr:hypothetical protein NliqN6_2311 [Naganishia liquefaciens]